jgi:hypothetical protein
LENRQVLSILSVHAGDDLQSILDNIVVAGDTLVLDAGATFVGPITLPNKAGDEWITIESSALDRLPGPGQRVGPDDAGFMPKIVSPGLGEAALETAPGAHNYRLAGIEFLPQTSDTFVYDLITLGDGSPAQTSLGRVPHDLTLDQCYIHAWPDQDLKRGIALNSAETSILDSYIADFKSVDQDSQAIAGWNGPGPYHIDNNYLEAAGENVLFGGDVASIGQLVPSNIDILGNEFFKPLTWKAGDPSFAGTDWTVKNLLELKNANQVLIAGNLFENNWAAGQDGSAILFTVRDQNGLMPWAEVDNVTFENNIVAHVGGAFNVLGTDNGPPGQTDNILIQNNLIENLDDTWGNGDFMQILAGANDVVVNHNTAFPTHTIIEADGSPSSGFVFENNLMSYGLYGIKGSDAVSGSDTLNAYLPGAIVTNNVLAGQPDQAAFYPSGNFFPGSLDAVGFVDRASGDYRLSASSPYAGAGTDGKDVGADINAILAAMNTTGVPQAPSSLTAMPASPTEIDLAWGSAAGAVSYEVERSPDGDSNWTQIAATTAGVTTFADTSLAPGGTWFYRVRASNLVGDSDYSGTVSATSLAAGGAVNLVLTGLPASSTAGTMATFTVTITDADGNPVPGLLDTIHFSSSDPQAVLPSDYTFNPRDNGVHTFSLILKTSGMPFLTVTDLTTSYVAATQAPVAVQPAPASRLVIAGLAPALSAGTSTTLTVTAEDPFGNIATGYGGTVHLVSSDPAARSGEGVLLPFNYTFTTTDEGVHTFSATLVRAGTQSVAVTDLLSPAVTGSEGNIRVDPGPAMVLRVVGLPASAMAGSMASFSITATDAYGNTETGYRGTVHFTSTDVQAVLPADYTFMASDNGTHSFSVIVKTAGSQTLTAVDRFTTGLIGAQAKTLVSAAAARSLLVTGFPSSVVRGAAHSFTVTAKDPFGNIATGYRGTVHFTSSDRLAILPSSYTFTAADNGVHTFTASLETLGVQSLSASDVLTSTITGMQTGILVTGGGGGDSALPASGTTAAPPFDLVLPVLEAEPAVAWTLPIADGASTDAGAVAVRPAPTGPAANEALSQEEGVPDVLS